MKTYDVGSGKVVEMSDAAYYFSVKNEDYGGGALSEGSGTSVGIQLPDSPEPETIGDFKYIPEGLSNDIPIQIRKLLDANNLGEGVLNRLRGLHLGQGPAIYTESFENNLKVRKWGDGDKVVSDWIKSWDIDSYLGDSATDLIHGSIYYSKLIRNKGARIGNGAINGLKHTCAPDCRREWPDNNDWSNRVFVGDWSSQSATEIKGYRRFDPLKPFAGATMMDFELLYQYGRSSKHPAVPSYFGAINWMKRSNAVPIILENLTNNALNIKWHIISPAEYWAVREERLKEQLEKEGRQYHPKMLEELKDSVLKSLSNVLSGIANVGKFFHSESVLKTLEIGNKAELLKWEIIPIDMKIKDFIDAQIAVGNKAEQATTSGMGLHPALSNILVDGRVASGSEELYAYKLFVATDTYLFEQKLCAIVNRVIKSMWPNTETKVGIYRDVVMKEKEVSPDKRIKENA